MAEVEGFEGRPKPKVFAMAQGAPFPREDRYLVAGLSSMLDTNLAGATNSSKTNLRLSKVGSCYVHLLSYLYWF